MSPKLIMNSIFELKNLFHMLTFIFRQIQFILSFYWQMTHKSQSSCISSFLISSFIYQIVHHFHFIRHRCHMQWSIPQCLKIYQVFTFSLQYYKNSSIETKTWRLTLFAFKSAPFFSRKWTSFTEPLFTAIWSGVYR